MGLHLFFIVFYALVSGNIAPEYMFYVLVFQCAISVILKINSGKQVVAPITVIAISTIITTLSNVKLMANVGHLENKTYSYILPQHVPEAALIWCIGVSCFFVGYEFAMRRGFPSLRYDLKLDDMDKFFYIVILIAVTAPYISGIVALLGSAGGKLIFLAGQIGILVFARLWAVHGTRKFLNYSVCLLFMQTYHALMYSYLRFELIIPTIIFFIGYITGKKSLKAVFNIQIAPLFVMVFVFYSLFGKLGQNRSNFSQVVYEEYFAQHDELAGFAAAELDNEDGEERGGLLDRSSCLAQITCAVEMVKAHGFYYGEASQPLLVALIPRVLWPNKPQIALGQWFAIAIGGAVYNEDGYANNSINMTVPAELYIDFGFFGTILGCFFFGILIAMLWNSMGFHESELNLFGILYGGYILVLSLSTLVGDLQIIITHLSTYILIYMIKRFLPKKKLSEEPVPAI